MQLKLDPNETEHTLPDIVIALAGFIMSGNSVDYVDEEVLVLLT